ncbi:short-chain dehydrogenase/reductase [Xylariaceae sp. FL1272]|nr:short-chain dehydrogenase/reductase [Xylariaceae sp. FL1272]
MPLKTILITGCSPGGAGFALAKEFRNRGHTVFATIRGGDSRHQDTPTSASTSNSHSSPLEDLGVHILHLDGTSELSIAAAVASVRRALDQEQEQNRKHGAGHAHAHLDILINNAAVYTQMPLADVSLSDARAVFDANVFGVLAVTQAFLPMLIKSDTHRDGGLIANVSSLSAIMCPPWQGVYAASKAALIALGHTMRVEFAPLGVRVVTIVSGGVDSPFKVMRGNGLPEGSWYKSLSLGIEGKGSNDFKGMPTAEYAKGVVDDLLSSQPKPMLWRGAFAWVAWFLTWFGWVGMMDKSQISRSGLDRIGVPSRYKMD